MITKLMPASPSEIIAKVVSHSGRMQVLFRFLVARNSRLGSHLYSLTYYFLAILEEIYFLRLCFRFIDGQLLTEQFVGQLPDFPNLYSLTANEFLRFWVYLSQVVRVSCCGKTQGWKLLVLLLLELAGLPVHS
jgi:hypothetical protein